MADEWAVIRAMANLVYQDAGWTPNDVAYVKLGEKFLAVAIDTVVDKTDVPRGVPLEVLGRRAVTHVVSDLASKGIKPLGVVFSVSLPRKGEVAKAKAIARGIREASLEYSVKVLGGDTNEADNASVTCAGFGLAHKPLGRSGAKPGDVVYTTGLFGLTYIGLRLLIEGIQPEGEIERRAVEAFLKPRARLREGIVAVSTGFVTSSVDSSDGLSACLYQISELSRVGIEVERIPVYPGVKEVCQRREYDFEEAVFGGGEEFELVLTIDPRGEDRFLDSMRSEGFEPVRIGRVVEGEGVYLIEHQRRRRLKRTGWTHFSSGT